MLFSIAGSQGTGKSTLINALKDDFKSDIPKTSRSILADWNVTLSQVNNDRPLTIRFQEEILKRKLADEAPFVASDEVFVTERTFADLFVYALVAIGKDNEYSDWLDEYYLRCVEAQKSYIQVFYLKGGHFKPVEDGVRGTNIHYSRLVDLVMSDYTLNMSPSFTSITVLEKPDLNWRVDKVKQHVQLAINRKF